MGSLMSLIAAVYCFTVRDGSFLALELLRRQLPHRRAAQKLIDVFIALHGGILRSQKVPYFGPRA